jgi:hypothetical protein
MRLDSSLDRPRIPKPFPLLRCVMWSPVFRSLSGCQAVRLNNVQKHKMWDFSKLHTLWYFNIAMETMASIVRCFTCKNCDFPLRCVIPNYQFLCPMICHDISITVGVIPPKKTSFSGFQGIKRDERICPSCPL